MEKTVRYGPNLSGPGKQKNRRLSLQKGTSLGVGPGDKHCVRLWTKGDPIAANERAIATNSNSSSRRIGCERANLLLQERESH